MNRLLGKDPLNMKDSCKGWIEEQKRHKESKKSNGRCKFNLINNIKYKWINLIMRCRLSNRI